MDFDLKEYVKKAQRVFGSKYEYVGYKRNNGVRQSINVAIYCHEKDKYGREHGVSYRLWFMDKQLSGLPKVWTYYGQRISVVL